MSGLVNGYQEDGEHGDNAGEDCDVDCAVGDYVVVEVEIALFGACAFHVAIDHFPYYGAGGKEDHKTDYRADNGTDKKVSGVVDAEIDT